MYNNLGISKGKPFPWLPLERSLPHALIQNGAWNDQGIDIIGHKQCWLQTSDWNILWLKHPCPAARQYSISIDAFRTATHNQSHHFRFLSERSGYNDTPVHLSISNREDLIRFESTVEHQLIEGPAALPAIKDQWYTIKGHINSFKKEIRVEINAQLLGVWRLKQFPTGSMLSMGSNGVAWKTPASSGWSNLWIEILEL